MNSSAQDRHELLHRIQAEDFALYEVALYLDGHPKNKRALAFYEEHRKIAAMLRAEYEQKLAALSADPKVGEKKVKAASGAHRFAAEEAWLNEYVEIKLFKDNDKYKDDVYVAINGKNCVIRRGEWTRIRRKFALLLDQSEIQDLRTAELMSEQSNRFAAASRSMGM